MKRSDKRLFFELLMFKKIIFFGTAADDWVFFAKEIPLDPPLS